MVNSVLDYLKIFEKMKFSDIVISLKTSRVTDTVKAYRLMAEKCDYPLHLGITASGDMNSGIIKSAIGIGALLLEGIGDTIRVSLTGDPKKEVSTAQSILASLNLRKFGPQIVSCPTCGRCKVDIISIVEKLTKKIKGIKTPLEIAVMGCIVNGPGEAKEADIGIASGTGEGVLFKQGKVVKKVREEDYLKVLLEEIDRECR
jgi:(E)-4-hydroxy-3-methylbut-2-enyl-diphosphate synthase